MDPDTSRSGSPTPLQVASPDRINQQLPEKINQFNTLAMQSKQLERKTADAALKRAMLGREEAEAEMRRHREEARQLRKQLEESRERERRVGERLETVMENYGRAKETHSHTQALWEKEIRRARKETFKSQSAIVKLQEELKAARTSTKTAEEALTHEKERSHTREQEAFQARYELVSCQEELEKALQKVRMLEQERDAFKSLAKSEDEVVQMAAEGKLPLPPPDEEEEAAAAEETEAATETKEAKDVKDETTEQPSDAEAGSPTTSPAPSKRRQSAKLRVSSVALRDIQSSAASEAELEELTRLWQWEKQRADRASELVEYLEAECHLRACSCMRKRPRANSLETARKRPSLDPRESSNDKAAKMLSPAAQIRANMMPLARQVQSEQQERNTAENGSGSQRGPRQSTIFVPEEGVFRTVSMQEAEITTTAAEVAPAAAPAPAPAPAPVPVEKPQTVPATTASSDMVAMDTAEDHAVPVDAPIMYARTPSVEPPSAALPPQPRASLLSLFDAPHRPEAEPTAVAHVPATLAAEGTDADMPDAIPRVANSSRDSHGSYDSREGSMRSANSTAALSHTRQMHASWQHGEAMDVDMAPHEEEGLERDPTTEVRLSQAAYAVATTVTKVPLREETDEPSLAQRILAAQRTPTQSGHATWASSSTYSGGSASVSGSESSFSQSVSAVTPTTKTREQCLAQIRERRGRARSAAGQNPMVRSVSTSSRAGSRSDNRNENRNESRASSRHGSRSGSGGGSVITTAASTSGVTPRRPVTPGAKERPVSASMSRAGSVRRPR